MESTRTRQIIRGTAYERAIRDLCGRFEDVTGEDRISFVNPSCMSIGLDISFPRENFRQPVPQRLAEFDRELKGYCHENNLRYDRAARSRIIISTPKEAQ